MDLGSLKNKYRTDDGLSFGKFNTQKKESSSEIEQFIPTTCSCNFCWL